MTTSTNSIHILHFDDNPYDLQTFKTALAESSSGMNFMVENFSESETYLKRLHQMPVPDMVVLDIHTATKNPADTEQGFQIAKQTRKILPQCVIAMRSSLDDAASISEALKTGADDFISKAADKKELAARTLQAFLSGKLKRSPASIAATSESAVGETAHQIRNRIPRLLQSAIAAIHVYGESGTGKEVVADLIEQALGPNTPFVRVNCGAIPASILESELFGHVKGAFTGALNDRKGLVESAHGGWLFLDEVATLSAAAQIALLRVIENGEIRPLGSPRTKRIDVRLISATNESLTDLVQTGKFRKDLWQRLCDATITLPSLRERKQEIPELINCFAKTMRGGPYKVAATAIEFLSALDWHHGNIRELRNCLRAMSEFQVGGILTVASIPSTLISESAAAAALPESSIVDSENVTPSKRRLNVELRADLDPNYENFSDVLFVELLKSAAHDVKRLSQRSLASYLGLSRSAVSDRIKRLIEKNLCSDPEVMNLLQRIS